MKRMFLGMFGCFFALLFCSCSAGGGVSAQDLSNTVAQPFTAQLQVVCGGEEYTAQLSRDGDSLDVVMDSPALFRGMAISFPLGGGAAAVDFNGISFTVNPDDLPGAAAVATVVEILDHAAAPEFLTAERQEDTTILRGEGFEMQLLSSEEDGSLPNGTAFSGFCLSIPAHDITATVTNFLPSL